MRNWSSLNPNLSSWINALLLAGLLIVATSIVPGLHYLWTLIVSVCALIFYFISIILLFVGNLLPQFIVEMIVGAISLISTIVNSLIILLSPLILLLPIPIVAFAHHYLYFLLDRFYPDLDPTERGRVTGYFPGVVSWWNGLFALLVVIMAMLVSDAVLSILPILTSNFADGGGLQQLSNPQVYGAMEYLPKGTVYGTVHQHLGVSAASRIYIWVRMALMILGQPIYSPVLRLVIWIVAAAYMYQFEFIFREHLIAGDRGRNGDR